MSGSENPRYTLTTEEAAEKMKVSVDELLSRRNHGSHFPRWKKVGGQRGRHVRYELSDVTTIAQLTV